MKMVGKLYQSLQICYVTYQTNVEHVLPTILVLPSISQPMTMVDLIKEWNQVQMAGKSNSRRQKSNDLALQLVGFYLIWSDSLTN